MIARDEHLHVRRLLDALPDEQRHVIELAYFGGFSHSQIASISDCRLAPLRVGCISRSRSYASLSTTAKRAARF